MIPTEFKLKAWHVTNGFIAPAEMEITNIEGEWKLRRDNRWWPFKSGDIIVQAPNNQFYSLPYNDTMTKYCMTIKTHTGESITFKYNSPLDRALSIIALSTYCDIIKEWIE